MTERLRSERLRISPVLWLSQRGIDIADWPLVVYDPKLEPHDVYKGRKVAHDGTFLFTDEAIGKALSPFFDKQYGNPQTRQYVRFTIGDLRIATVFRDRVQLPVGEFPGQRERISVPYRVDLVPMDEVPNPVPKELPPRPEPQLAGVYGSFVVDTRTP